MPSSLPPQGLALTLPSAGLPFPASSLDRCLIFQGLAQLYFVGMLSLTPKAKAAPPPRLKPRSLHLAFFFFVPSERFSLPETARFLYVPILLPKKYAA